MATFSAVAARVLLAAMVGVFTACGGADAPDDGVLPVEPRPPVAFAELLRLSPCDIVSMDRAGSGDSSQLGGRPLDIGYPRATPTGTLRYPGLGDSTLVALMRPDSIVARSVTGTTNWENEAHDCQRLVRVNDGAWSFGPLVGVFPVAAAMAIDRPWSQPIAVATIYNWGDFQFNPSRYPQLNIEPGLSCLWLRSMHGEWQAAIVPSTDECAGQTEGPPSWPLLVQQSVHESAERLDSAEANLIYPASVRWGWNDTTDTHYIGIKCGAAWCSIGNTLPPVAAVFTDDEMTTIPGWFDVQNLAVDHDGDPLTPVVPGPLGRVVPARDNWRMWNTPQGRAMTKDQRRNAIRNLTNRVEGLFVARIIVQGDDEVPHGDITPYRRKLHLRGSDPARTRIRLQGRFDVSNSLRALYDGEPAPVAPNVTFVPGVSHSVSGAVRWRWQEQDEKTWTSCEEGCCTIRR